MDSYDVIVIGSGAGGGTLVHRLAPSGKRVLLLERGDWLPREPPNWSAHDVFMDNRYISPDTWYDAETAKAFQPQVHYFVGGATKLYGAALYRQHGTDDFAAEARRPFPAIREHVLLPQAGSIAEADERLAPRVTPELLESIVAQVPEEWLQGRERRDYVNFLARRLEPPRAFVDEAAHVA